MDLQELITRGRFVFSAASERLRLFELVNGRRNTPQLATTTRRHVNNVRRDLTTLRDAGLIQEVGAKDGRPLRVGGFPVYEKVPLARTISLRYFSEKTTPLVGKAASAAKADSRRAGKRLQELPIPSEQGVLEICKDGEDQLYEFKAAATDVKKITREIAAMLNTKQGGIILYGVDDEGTIQGSDLTRQKFDQPLQNSVRNSISPTATITLKSISVLGALLLVIVVPPWNRRDVYQLDGRILIRKGTNVFAAGPGELRKLHKGDFVV